MYLFSTVVLFTNCRCLCACTTGPTGSFLLLNNKLNRQFVLKVWLPVHKISRTLWVLLHFANYYQYGQLSAHWCFTETCIFSKQYYLGNGIVSVSFPVK